MCILSLLLKLLLPFVATCVANQSVRAHYEDIKNCVFLPAPLSLHLEEDSTAVETFLRGGAGGGSRPMEDVKHIDPDATRLVEGIQNWNRDQVYSKIGGGKAPNMLVSTTRTPPEWVENYWAGVADSDPGNEDVILARTQEGEKRIQERRLAYQVSFFVMPMECRQSFARYFGDGDAHRAAVMEFLSASAVWGKATAGAGRLACNMGAVYNGKALGMYAVPEAYAAAHAGAAPAGLFEERALKERGRGIWQSLFRSEDNWLSFQQEIVETVRRRDDVKLFVRGADGHLNDWGAPVDPESIVLLLEHRLWMYKTWDDAPTTGTWHRDLQPFVEHFENTGAESGPWWRAVKAKLGLEDGFFNRAFTQPESVGRTLKNFTTLGANAKISFPMMQELAGPLFEKSAHRKAVMLTLVNSLAIHNLDASVAGSRLRARSRAPSNASGHRTTLTGTAYQFPAVSGLGAMFRSGGDAVSGSGLTSASTDYDVPYHAGPTALQPKNGEGFGARVFLQTKVLVIKTH